MRAMPPCSTPELGAGPRFALDRRCCEVANRWGALHAAGVFFAVISRLGDDGLFWYSLRRRSP